MAKVSAAVQDAADEIVLVIDNSGPLWHRKIEIIAKNVKCFSAPLTGNGCRARFTSLVAAGVADAVRAAPDDKERNKALRTVTAQRLAANELRDSARAMIKSGEWAKHYAAKYGGGAALAGPVPRRGTKRAKIAPGYAFAATGPDWREIPNDDWENVIVPSHKIDEPGYFRIVGKRKIDGSMCFVWEQRKDKHGAGRVFWAQTTAHHGRGDLRGAAASKRGGRSTSGLRGWTW